MVNLLKTKFIIITKKLTITPRRTDHAAFLVKNWSMQTLDGCVFFRAIPEITFVKANLVSGFSNLYNNINYLY